MKALILTNHLAQFGGSEIVAVEVAEEFQKAGCDVTIVSGYIDYPIKLELEQMGTPFTLVDEISNVGEFDLIWSQHHLLAYLVAKHGLDIIKNCCIVSVSLSAFHPLEVPGAIAEVSDFIFANSPETAKKLSDYGIKPDRIKVFYNAAPSSFLRERRASGQLTKLLIISNHAPDELMDASKILRSRKIVVDHIGKPNDERRITSDVISNYDALITIGKSVQYGILSEVPVFVYDHFGGPGWLSLDNLQKAEDFNFSGRCCRRRLSADEIAEEVFSGYEVAAKSIREIKEPVSSKYLLSNYISELISLTAQRQNRRIPQHFSSLLRREGIAHGELINHWRLAQQQSGLIRQLEITIAEMERVRASQQEEVNQKQKEIAEVTALFSAQQSDYTLLLNAHDAAIRNFLSKEKIMEREITRLTEEINLARHHLTLMHESTSWRITKPLRSLRRALRNRSHLN